MVTEESKTKIKGIIGTIIVMLWIISFGIIPRVAIIITTIFALVAVAFCIYSFLTTKCENDYE